jgi:ABC-type multidrug transport system ATPase subunit
VFGYLGANGAGKSTTIRLLLDLIRPTAGGARMLGLETRTDGAAIRRLLGYLSRETYGFRTGSPRGSSSTRSRGCAAGWTSGFATS